MNKENNMPTDAELDILGVLWSYGPSTVRFVYENLSSHPPRGYTTVLKLMQIMFEKGLVTRDESNRAHIYKACFSQEQTQNSLLSNLLDKAFSGSAAKMIMRALSSRPATDEEFKEIRKLIDNAEGKKNDS